MRSFSYIFAIFLALMAYGCGGSSNGSSPEVPNNQNNGGGDNNGGNEEGNGDEGGETTSNRAPVITVLKTSLNEDEVTVIAKAVDPDNDGLTLEILTQPMLGMLYLGDTDNTDIVYAPFENQFGEDTVRFRVKDSENNTSNEVTVTLVIAPVYDAPSAQNVDVYLDIYAGSLHTQALEFNLSGSGDDIRDITLKTLPYPGNLMAGDNFQDDAKIAKAYAAPLTLKYFAYDVFTGQNPVSFEYSVTNEDEVESANGIVTINFIYHAAPVSEDMSFEIDEDTSTELFELAGTTTEEGVIVDKVALLVLPSNGELLGEDGKPIVEGEYPAPLYVIYKPHQDFEGTEKFYYNVGDSTDSYSSTSTVQINVHEDNADTILKPAVSGDVSKPQAITEISLTLARGTLLPNECAKIRFTKDPEFGEVALSNCVATYRVTAAFENVIDGDSFTYENPATQQTGTAIINFHYCGDGKQSEGETKQNCPVDFAEANTFEQINTIQPGSVDENANFSPTKSMTLASGVYTFNSIQIPSGVTIKTKGIGILIFRAKTINVAGIIDLNGGGTVFDTTYWYRGGNTGSHSENESGTGIGGVGPRGQGGSGTDLGYSFGGEFGGGSGGNNKASSSQGYPYGGSGGGGGGAFGGNGGRSYENPGFCAPGGTGAGNVGIPCHEQSIDGSGGVIGDAALADLAVNNTFYPGSGGGGGGGSASIDDGLGFGGGGGGGGGAIRLVAKEQLAVSGSILADGGMGNLGVINGTPNPEVGGGVINGTISLNPGAGGGGSGGVIDLRAPLLNILGTVSALFGEGPRNNNGGNGRIRISAEISECTLTSNNFYSHIVYGGVCSVNAGTDANQVYIDQWPN